MYARAGLGAVDQETCERIACGVLSQAAAGSQTLFECSVSFPLGALPCSSWVCAKFGGCGPVFPAVEAPAVVAAPVPVAARVDSPAPPGTVEPYQAARSYNVVLPAYNPSSGKPECPDAYPVGQYDKYGQLVCRRTAATDIPVAWPYPTGAAVRAAATGTAAPVSAGAAGAADLQAQWSGSLVADAASWCSRDSVIPGVGNCLLVAAAAVGGFVLFSRRRKGGR